ncbi:vitamin B12 transporter [Fluviicoccus keumensis]|uniref:Vitamin B12 transporter n=1 Tax=Fluviicoccus keumensis TaxID=1435465 RepID=A0A4Q7YKG5_9GAMM|nr:TonB-dependent receptor [Fluviicoccus keumensis]RZU36989.1 vitamin B12 transporter [Fluviicoccus keumensis]
MFKPSILAAAVAACSSLPVFAETVLPVQIITASRMSTPIDQALASVDVIDRNTLDAYRGRDLSEILRYVAGMDAVRSGGPGGQTSLFTRGTESNHTLILIDGIRINSATSSQASIQNLTLDDIERIEVVKGPLSSLYGSEALGGVINLITREGRENRSSASVTAGGQGQIAAGYNQSVNRGALHSFVQFSSLNQDGYASIAANPNKRGQKNQGADINASYHGEDFSLQLQLRDNHGETEYISQAWTPGPVDLLQSQTFINRIAALKLSADLGNNQTSSIRISQLTDKLDQNQSTDYAHTLQDTVELQHTAVLAPTDTLIAGVTLTRTDAAYNGIYDLTTRNKAVFLQNTWNDNLWNLRVSGRHEKFDEYGSQNTGSLAIGRMLAAGHSIYASAGTGFKTPDFNERFDTSYGSNNPKLKPEKSKSVEIGSRHRIGNIEVSTAFFRTALDNLISYNKAFVLENIDQAKSEGLELNARWTSADGWFAGAKAGYIHSRNSQTGMDLDRRPRRSLSLNGGFRQENWGVSSAVLAKSHAGDFGGQRLPGYAVVNGSVYLLPSPGLKLMMSLENIGDIDYGSAYYDTGRLYLAAPFTATLSATLSF